MLPAPGDGQYVRSTDIDQPTDDVPGGSRRRYWGTGNDVQEDDDVIKLHTRRQTETARGILQRDICKGDSIMVIDNVGLNSCQDHVTNLKIRRYVTHKEN